MRFIRQPCKLFFCKPPENGVHSRSTHLQILGDRLGIPSVSMEPNHRSPTRLSIRHLRIAWIASLGCRGFGTRGQNELDRCWGRLAVEFHETNGRDLVWMKGRILSIQIHDLLPDVGRKGSLVQFGNWRWRFWMS